MNGLERHPDSEQLDRLRAGLLDDSDPQQRARLETHLRECSTCRRAYDWPARLAGLETPDAQLDALRRRATAGGRTRRHQRLLPLAAAAALALAAVGLVSLLPSPSSPPAPQVASGERTPVPELYEDLDFYLWLADHKESADHST